MTPSIEVLQPPILNNMEDQRVDSLPKQHYDFASAPPAVSVHNACKSYSNGVAVLKNFNMTVPQGTIYGLLGASGCGKTTMLSCIVGIRKLDSGDIFVFGQRPGTPESGIPGKLLGYMPQDTALYRQLSIKEMLQYFGRIYGMSHSEIITRIEFLSHFLDLPPSSSRIGNLSGGQARRTSLAACLLHEPSLLILDEPTVGVDPLLRESIWEYLCDIVAKKHTTVIITTHYIEEARQSNTVGLMRNGRLLTEKAPDVLLEEHHAAFLEDIVLKLCKDDLEGFGESHQEEVSKTLAENSFYSRRKNMKQMMKQSKVKENAVVGLKFKKTIDENQNSNQSNQLKRKVSLREQTSNSIWGKFSRVRAVAVRNILTLVRSPIFMLSIFFMPSFQLVIVNLTLGPEPKNLKFGVINPEINYDLAQCKDFPKGCVVDQLSCRYIKTLPNNIIDPVSMNSVEDALQGVRSGRLWGYMAFPKNFSQHLADRALAGNFAENSSLDGSTISLRLDKSDYFASALLTKSLYESYQVFAKNMLSACNQTEKKAEVPLNFENPVYGSLDITFQDYISPGVLLIILFFIPYLSCSITNITDRKQGTLDRSMVAGITITDILAAFFCTEGFLIVVQTLISYLIVLFVFQLEIKGSVIAYGVICIMTGFAGLSLGFLIAQLVDEEMEALVLGVGFYLPNLIFCGIIWPLEAAPLVIRLISYCLPCTWAINGVRSIVSRGWSVTHQYVWPGYAVLLTWIVGTWIFALLAFRARSR